LTTTQSESAWSFEKAGIGELGPSAACAELNETPKILTEGNKMETKKSRLALERKWRRTIRLGIQSV
jgi:hypothetical protein